MHKHKKGIQKHLKYHPSIFDIKDTWFWLLWKHTSSIYKQDSHTDMYDDMGGILMILSSHYGTHWSNWSTVKFQDTRRSNRDQRLNDEVEDHTWKDLDWTSNHGLTFRTRHLRQHSWTVWKWIVANMLALMWFSSKRRVEVVKIEASKLR